MEYVKIGSLSVSRFILGSNPFSGFSHQSLKNDMEMRHYYTTDCIKKTLRAAEAAGVNTIIARGDHHVIRFLMEYWDEGGTLQWLCQTCPELGSPERAIDSAIQYGAKGCFIHGGVMDLHLAQGMMDKVGGYIQKIRGAGLVAGVAGHNPEVHAWVQANLDVDFHMCSYYNPTDRSQQAEHKAGADEKFVDADREAMVRQIPLLSKPVIHYKILAAGRNNPKAAFAFAGKHMRAGDMVCAGVFPKHKPTMIQDDVKLLEAALGGR